MSCRVFRKVDKPEDVKSLNDVLVLNSEEVFPKHFVDYFKKRNLKRLYRFGVLKLYLSHFHSDHYGCLSQNWCRKGVICSLKTARLVNEVLCVPSHLIFYFRYNLPIFKNPEDNIQVFPLWSNHILGSAMFLFVNTRSQFSILHTTDFRYDDDLQKRLSNDVRKILGGKYPDHVFLDCTNSHYFHNLPSREESSMVVIRSIKKIQSQYPNAVFNIEMYNSGKDVLLYALVKEFGTIGCFEMRKKVAKYAFDGVLDDKLTVWKKTINVVTRTKFRSLLKKRLGKRDRATVLIRVSAFHSNQYSIRRLQNKKWLIHIPYSDHSSSFELKKFLYDFKINEKKKVTCLFGRCKNPLQVILASKDLKPSLRLFEEGVCGARNLFSIGGRLPQCGF